eukprot:614622-Rhodomonas_salina.1
MPPFFWEDSWHASDFLENVSKQYKKGSMITRWEARYGKPPDLSALVPFGCLAFYHLTKANCTVLNLDPKFSYRAQACVFIGYERHLNKKGYQLYVPATKR